MKTLRLKRGNREGSGKPEEGVTLIEFALVAMIFLIFVVALFDFVRFLIVQSILRSSANRALSQAQVIADLDQDCLGLSGTAATTCINNRSAAFGTVLNTLRTLPVNTMVARSSGEGMHYLLSGTLTQPAIELNLSRQNDYRAVFTDGADSTATQPASKSSNLQILDNLAAAASRPTLRAVLQQEPIQVTINARFKPVLPILPEFPLQGTAAGYREIRGASSYPARVNCRGAEVPIGQAPNNSDCPCGGAPGNPLIHVVNGGNCICVSNQMNPVTNPNGDVINCACPHPRVADGLNCVCPAASCPSGGSVNQSTCSCACPGNLQVINGVCGCESPLTNQNGNCACTPNPNCISSGGILNGSSCVCQCPHDRPYNPQTGRCECPHDDEDECEHGQLDGACNCQCTNGYTMSNGDCRCLSPHVVQNGQCTCPNNIPCQGGWIDGNTCQCNCVPPKTLHNGVCSCGTVACQGGTVDQNSCSCNCSNGYSLVNGACVCPSPRTVQNGQCGCPNVPCGGGWIDQNSCSCTCQYPKTLQNGTCTCPSVSCTGGQIDPNSCGCTCQNGFNLVNGVCRCDAPRVVENGTCRCSSSIGCNNGTVDQNSCQCTCTSPRVYQAGACVCDQNLCQGGTLSPSCGCTCGGGQVLVGNQCQCTGGQVFQGGSCSCTGGQVLTGGQCHCPQNQEMIGGTCQCPEGTTMLQDGSCFRPE